MADPPLPQSATSPPPTRAFQVWRQSFHGFVAILGLLFGLVALGIGGALLADHGPEPAVGAFLAVALVSAAACVWGRAYGKETLELALDLANDTLVMRRGPTVHVFPRLSSMVRARLVQAEVGRAPGEGDAALIANWIFVERAQGEEHLVVPERFQEGDSKRIVAAINELLADPA